MKGGTTANIAIVFATGKVIVANVGNTKKLFAGRKKNLMIKNVRGDWCSFVAQLDEDYTHFMNVPYTRSLEDFYSHCSDVRNEPNVTEYNLESIHGTNDSKEKAKGREYVVLQCSDGIGQLDKPKDKPFADQIIEEPSKRARHCVKLEGENMKLCLAFIKKVF